MLRSYLLGIVTELIKPMQSLTVGYEWDDNTRQWWCSFNAKQQSMAKANTGL